MDLQYFGRLIVFELLTAFVKREKKMAQTGKKKKDVKDDNAFSTRMKVRLSRF